MSSERSDGRIVGVANEGVEISVNFDEKIEALLLSRGPRGVDSGWKVLGLALQRPVRGELDLQECTRRNLMLTHSSEEVLVGLGGLEIELLGGASVVVWVPARRR